MLQSKTPDTAALGSPFVSVVVPLFTHSSRVWDCLQHLSRQTYDVHCYEVILVNNTGAPLTFPRLENLTLRIVDEARQGSYAARNQGVAHGRGSVVAFTDADCLPAPEWIERGVAKLLSAPHFGLIGGRIDVRCADPDRPTPVELYEIACSFRQQEYVDRWRFAATANAFTFRRVFDEVHGFDPDLFSLGDREWARRVVQAGHTVGYADDAPVSHPSRRTFRELAARTSRITGGFYRLTVQHRWPLRVLAADAWLGLAPRRRLFCRAPAAADRPLTLHERITVGTVCGFVVAVRVAELVRLAVGGRPVRS